VYGTDNDSRKKRSKGFKRQVAKKATETNTEKDMYYEMNENGLVKKDAAIDRQAMTIQNPAKFIDRKKSTDQKNAYQFRRNA